MIIVPQCVIETFQQTHTHTHTSTYKNCNEKMVVIHIMNIDELILTFLSTSFYQGLYEMHS